MGLQVIEYSGDIPTWVVFMHRMGRMGRADNIVPTPTTGRYLVRFNMDMVRTQKWPELHDADTVWLTYRGGDSV
jgi:hypothetical protein